MKNFFIIAKKFIHPKQFFIEGFSLAREVNSTDKTQILTKNLNHPWQLNFLPAGMTRASSQIACLFFKFIIFAGLALLMLCLLSSCSKTYYQAKHNIEDTADQMQNAEMVSDQSQPTVITKSGFFINPHEIPINGTPDWMLRHVSIHTQHLPLNLLLNQLVHYYPAVVNYDASVSKRLPITLNYSGTLQGALNAISSITNYTYTINEQSINWSAFETKTFDISFMPGASTYLVGQEQNQSITNSYINGSPVNQINDQQYSNLHGALSVWRDLEMTINQLKSKDGHVVVSESTTTVTVNDHPSNVNAIRQYINQLNHRLSQQVAIKVQVLEIALNKDFNYGLDWNLLTNALGTKISIRGSPGNATNLVNDNIISSSSNSALTRFGIGSRGTDVFINALSQQGKVRVVTEPEVTTMNNQIAAIRITQSVGYIESVSQTSNQYFSTNSITPGSITDGFTLYILPKIQNDQVYMQISSTIANLEKLEKVSTIPDNASNSSINNNSQFQAIQVPTLAQKSFNQRSVIESGSTLIIAGYKRLQDATSDASFFGIAPLGGRGASIKNIETLVLITPTILHSSHSDVDNNTQ